MSALTIDTVVPVLPPRRTRHLVVVPVRSAGARTAVAPDATLRLTRRGRLLVTLLCSALVLAVAVVGARTALADTATVAPATTQVTVLPGQTLWGIASAADPAADPRDAVIEIRDLNGLPDSQVFAGQVLTVPAG